jgi:hypothetical protein
MTGLGKVLAAAAPALATTSMQAAGAQQQGANRKNATDFYDKALQQKDFDAASRYPGPRRR